MDVAKAAEIVLLMLSPTLLVGAALICPRAFRVARRGVRSATASVEPTQPPIEQLAYDLRRLLHRYQILKQSPQVAKRAQHLLALEAAITDCAADAARALGVPCPDRSRRGPLPTSELRVLLSALAAAGLVLRPTTGLFAADGSF